MRLDSVSRTSWLLAGLSLRIAMLGWGIVQDRTSAVPYTDIDYDVFTSAAKHLVSACPLEEVISVPSQEEYEDLIDPPEARGSCAQGIVPATCRFILQAMPEIEGMDGSTTSGSFSPPPPQQQEELVAKLTKISFSILTPIFRFFAGLGNPYKRDTYRYTPLLAVLLAPGELIKQSAYFGKAVFILADLFVALLIWDIMDLRRTRRNSKTKQNWLAGLIWLVNPFTAQISTRGSSESILGVIVLGFIDATMRSYPERGLMVEVESKDGENNAEEDQEALQGDGSRWNNAALSSPFLLAASIHWKLYPIIYAAALVPHLARSESTRAVFRFGGIAVYSLFGISLPVWAIWGRPYLNETLLYHIYRSDHRHNFSPFFLSSYLSTSPFLEEIYKEWPRFFRLITPLQSYLSFIPQLGLAAYLGFSIGGHDLVAAITFQTIAFVALNKVCTSQYFMWILWFLPIIAPSLHFSGGLTEVLTMVAVWVFAQAVWLSQAYLLEFKAQDTFVRVWLASLFLLATHVWLLIRLLQAWAAGRTQLLRHSEHVDKVKLQEGKKAQ